MHLGIGVVRLAIGLQSSMVLTLQVLISWKRHLKNAIYIVTAHNYPYLHGYQNYNLIKRKGKIIASSVKS